MKPVRHRPKVRRWREETSQGEAWCYQVRCPCGEEFDEHYAKKLAVSDRLRHLMDVAPPLSERCRDPRAHRCRPHDHCPLCAGQATLPGFEDLVTTPTPRCSEEFA
uniref:hypothetical protein n=1 Tax=Nocardiopsis sp. 90127 TaxID=373213 RepID=UPI001867FCCD|nr:hypothetical protein [Nocardiopsis sp. 90127]